MSLPVDKKDRKERPIARGVLDYFPDALAEVANVSFLANAQHNPGEEMHWDKSKSTDHADSLMRHLAERGKRDTDKLLHSAKVAWRALAMLQIELENEELARRHTDLSSTHVVGECEVCTPVNPTTYPPPGYQFVGSFPNEVVKVAEQIASGCGCSSPAPTFGGCEQTSCEAPLPKANYDGDWNISDQTPGFWRVTGNIANFHHPSNTPPMNGEQDRLDWVKEKIDAGYLVRNTWKYEAK